MNKKEISNRLNDILRKIQESTIYAWEYDLEETTEAIAVEDHEASEDEHITYNGWLEDLSELVKELKQL